ncbi:TPA: DUF4365 domain-containing protein [Vibrio cholerae]|nr:DUF4365 domain-containing protein [Vibrio cholerae]
MILVLCVASPLGGRYETQESYEYMNLPMSSSVLFEDDYLDEFNCNFKRNFGLELAIPKDFIGIDTGLVLYSDNTRKCIGSRKIWFQFKGIEAGKKTSHRYDTDSYITARNIKMTHIKYWGTFGEPVYLTVYSQKDNKFYYIDSEQIQCFYDASKTQVDIRIEKSSCLDNEFFENQRSLAPSVRAEATYKGRILAINLDPLRSSVSMLKPEIYQNLILRLLKCHNFIESSKSSISTGERVDGILLDPLETPIYWTITYAFSNSIFRGNGDFESTSGELEVYIVPDISDFDFEGLPVVPKGRKAVLFYNDEESDVLFGKLRSKNILPISNHSVTYNLILSPVLFNEFKTDVKWAIMNPLISVS